MHFTPNNLQMLINGMSVEAQKERAKTQMTLGQVIEALEKIKDKTVLLPFHYLCSYRGYYEDLAFVTSGAHSIEEVLKDCKDSMGEIFTGYKGGEFQMGKNTPVHVVDSHENTGTPLISISEEGEITTGEGKLMKLQATVTYYTVPGVGYILDENEILDHSGDTERSC
jgi:hypothetical protein